MYEKIDKNILFSVVIPLYNKKEYILRAVESVLFQSYEGLELLIIDDGSTDNSAAELNKIKDKRISIVHQNNSGVSIARNRGIREANYDFIAFLDADDFWDSEYLALMSRLIRKFPKSIMYSSGYMVHNKEHSYERKIQEKGFDNYSIVNNYEYYRITNKWGMQASSTIIRKIDFTRHDNYFPIGIQEGEDSWVWDRFSLLGEVAAISDILVHYSGDIPGQITANKNNSLICATVYGMDEFLHKYRLSLISFFWSECYIKSLLISKINLCHGNNICIKKIISDKITQKYLSRLTISILKSRGGVILNLFLIFLYFFYHSRFIRRCSPSIIKKMYKNI